MQSVSEKVGILRATVQDEINSAVDSVLERLYPDDDLHFSDLKKTSGRGGKIALLHPKTKAEIGEWQVIPEREKTKRTKRPWGIQKEKITLPRRETISIYAKEGHLDTELKIKKADLPDGHDEDELRVIADIKEYYPPNRKQQLANKSKDKTPRTEEKSRVLELKASRGLKRRNGTAANFLETYTSQFGASSKNGAPKEAEDEKNNKYAGAKTSTSRGRVKRAKAYRLKKIKSEDKKDVRAEDFALNDRIAKDRYNHPNGNYTVIQHAGSGYTTVLYSHQGQRLEQKSYDDEGAVTKALGKETKFVLKRKKQPPPSDKASNLKAKGRVRTVDLFELRRTWQAADSIEEEAEVTPDEAEIDAAFAYDGNNADVDRFRDENGELKFPEPRIHWGSTAIPRSQYRELQEALASAGSTGQIGFAPANGGQPSAATTGERPLEKASAGTSGSWPKGFSYNSPENF